MKILRYNPIVTFLILEISSVLLAFRFSHGWLPYSVIIFTSANLFFAMILLAAVYARKNNMLVINKDNLKGVTALTAVCLIGFAGIGIWIGILAPQTMQYLVKSHGTDALATVKTQQAYVSGNRRDYATNNISNQSELVITLTYNGHRATLLVDNPDKETQVRQAIMNGERLHVRYLSAIPKLVYLRTDLGLPGRLSEDVNRSASTYPTFQVPAENTKE